MYSDGKNELGAVPGPQESPSLSCYCRRMIEVPIQRLDMTRVRRGSPTVRLRKVVKVLLLLDPLGFNAFP